MTQKHQYFTEVGSTPIYNSQRENTVTEGRDRAVLANVTQRRINTPHPLSPRTRTNRTARAAENLSNRLRLHGIDITGLNVNF